MKPVITLKNLKHAEFASEETHCYSATVYLDGKRFCLASNDGHGGPDRYDAMPTKGRNFSSGEEAGAARRQLDHDIHALGLRANPKAVEKYDDAKVERVPFDWEDYDEAKYHRHMLEDPGHTTYEVFEHLVGRALTHALCRKDMMGAFRRKWLYRKPDGKLYECKKKPGDTVENMTQSLKEAVPGAVLLQALPEAEALAIWMDYA
jgi:hypothetical protein